jgi:hypothetical protein
MNKNPTDTDLIERYLLGKLTDAEIRNFDVRLRDDREFARKYRLITTFPEMMSDTGRLEYEKKLAEAAVPVVKKKPARIRIRRYYIWTGASFIACAAIVLLFIFRGSHNLQKNIVREDKTVHKADVVTVPVVQLKDTSKVLPPKQEQEKRESVETTAVSVQKAIELISPAGGMKISRNETIVFNWKQKTDSFTRFYIISIPHDQVVYWRGVRPGIREYKVPASYLYPGEYYWYVGTKEDKRTFTVIE